VVIPRAASHFATSIPSLWIESAMNPPPGQITAALLVGVPPVGLNTKRLGRVTFATTSVFQTFEKYCFSG
jgi:hypothetical protein